MENIEAILDVEGLDMVQFGGGDYSVSIGQPGGGSGKETRGAYMRLIKLALAKGVHPRVELGSLEQAKPYLDMGVRHFCVGWDLTTLFRWGRAQGELLEELELGTPERRSLTSAAIVAAVENFCAARARSASAKAAAAAHQSETALNRSLIHLI